MVSEKRTRVYKVEAIMHKVEAIVDSANYDTSTILAKLDLSLKFREIDIIH